MRRALLLLRWRRGRGDGTALTTLAGHDGAEGIGAHADGRGRSLWRALMRRRADHGTLGSATSGLFELSAEMGDLFFELLLERHVGLLHRVNLLANQLHFINLGLNLVLVVFALANLGLELGADVVEQFVQAGRAVPSGWDAPHASVRIHGHDCDTSIVRATIDSFWDGDSA